MNGYKVCPNCGRQNPADAQWCASCGNSISNVASPQEWQQPQQSNQAQSGYGQPQYQAPPNQYQQPPAYGQPQYQAPGVASAPGGAKQQIANAIQMRVQTDEIMPVWWLLLPVVGLVVIMGMVAAFVLSGISWGWIGIVGAALVFALLYALFIYKLVNRQNEHLKREVILRGAMINYLREKAREQYKEQLIMGQISTMESINQEASYKEQENNALLFTIMSFIPLLNLYVLYQLTKYPFEHDNRWHAFTQQAQYAFSQVGINIITPSWKTLPRRSFWLYLVVTFFIGIFMIYWLYVLIDDPNEHYKAQWQFEDQLMSQLR